MYKSSGTYVHTRRWILSASESMEWDKSEQLNYYQARIRVTQRFRYQAIYITAGLNLTNE